MLPAEADRASRNAALTLALTLPGDTLLYLLLPLHAAAFGVTLPEAGVLLAANRIVRIFGYQWVARLYGERGPRTACLLAVIGSLIAVMCYATQSGLWLLLAARLVWGLSYAAMNIATQALPTAAIEGAAVRTGKTRAIISAGPMLALVGGAIIDFYWGPRVVFAALCAVTLLAFVFTWPLPRTPENVRREGPRFSRPSPINVWSFSMGFTIDGLFMFGLSLLAAQTVPHVAVLAAGAAMALRYGSEVALSHTGGALAERYGARRMMVGLSLVLVGTLVLSGTWGALLWAGVLGTIVLRALVGPMPGPVIAEAYPGPARVPALASQAVWRDIGAGTGPMAAGLLFPVASALAIMIGGAGLVAASTLVIARADRAGRGRIA